MSHTLATSPNPALPIQTQQPTPSPMLHPNWALSFDWKPRFYVSLQKASVSLGSKRRKELSLLPLSSSLLGHGPIIYLHLLASIWDSSQSERESPSSAGPTSVLRTT